MVLAIDSDVLVIGTGGAGLRAAIEADSLNANVVVVSKSPAGMNNATVMAGGGFRAALKGLTPEEHFKDTIRVGKNLNDPKLVKVFTDEGGNRVAELKEFGVDIHLREGGAWIGEIPTLRGLALTEPLVEYLRSKEVEILENVIITKLLKKGEKIVGAVGYHVKDTEPVIFSSKAVILATGGAGALYKRTDCPLRTTGDGYSLGYHAGAKLRDMEFVQFYPIALAEPGTPPFLLSGDIIEKGKITNGLGEDIPNKYDIKDRPLVIKSRDLLSRALMLEILQGGGVGGAVLIDAREVIKKMSKEELESTGPYQHFIQKKVVDKPIRVAPICHFFMGGIEINSQGETNVPGLFACGETTGGVHGANRHGGNALTSITVFGARAGATAAQHAKKRKLYQVEKLANPEIERYRDIISREIGISSHLIMEQLREYMWINAGIIRDAFKLSDAFQKIQELRDMAKTLKATHEREMLFALEVTMALDNAEMIVRAGMKRKESRGAHYRTDFPEKKQDWLKTVIIQKGDKSAMILATRSLLN